MLLVVILAVLGAGVRAQQVQEKMGIWVPLYVDTLKSNDAYAAEYSKLISSVEKDPCLKDSFHGTVLTGPRSGPPNVTDPWEDKLFRARFQSVAETGQWTAFGYVRTKYGERPLEQVIADIDAWLAPGAAGFGDQVQGIWVDQVVNNFGPAQKDYYKAVADHIRSGYGKLVAFNPGSNVADCKWLESIGVDFVNNFENTYATWSSRPFTCGCKGLNTRCIASIHSYPVTGDKAQVQKDLESLYNRGYRAAFLTDKVVPNQYNGMPKFWEDVVQTACLVDVSGQPAGGGTGGATDGTAGGTTGGTTGGTGGGVAQEPEGVLPPPLKEGEWWRPTTKQRYNYQFTPFDAGKDFIPGVQVYVLPLFETSPETIKKLKSRSTASSPVYTVCFFSAISAAPSDADFESFAKEDLTGPVSREGKIAEGEQGVNWQGSDRVQELMAKRLELCKEKGFDGAEPAYLSDYNPGRIPYMQLLAKAGHGLGLAMGASDQMQNLDQLTPYYDFFTTNWCSVITRCNMFPVVEARKGLASPDLLPIWDLEWGPGTAALDSACARKGPMFGMRPIGKNDRKEVDAPMTECPADP